MHVKNIHISLSLKAWVYVGATVLLLFALAVAGHAQGMDPKQQKAEQQRQEKAAEKLRKETEKKAKEATKAAEKKAKADAKAEAEAAKKAAKITPRIAPKGETPEEAKIRLRAIQIETAKALKEVEEKIEEKDTPAMKQARKEIEEENERIAKKERERIDTLSDAKIAGCDPSTVEVESFAEKSTRFRPMISIRLVNKVGPKGELVTIDRIETAYKGYGPLIRNLCPGGSISMNFPMDWNNGDRVRIPLTVVGSLPSGQTITKRKVVTISWTQSERAKSDTWEVQLGR